MHRKLKYFLIIITVCLLLVSVVMNIFAFQKIKSMRILGYIDIGMGKILNSDITKTYISVDDNPDKTGEFDNIEAVSSLFELLKTGCYQEAPTPKYSTAPGSYADPWMRIESDRTVFSIAVHGNVLSITVDGETTYYYSNIRTQIATLIQETAYSTFGE